MNRENFYVGLGMLAFPFLVLAFLFIAAADINWFGVGMAVLGIAYFGTALFLLIKGAVERDD